MVKNIRKLLSCLVGLIIVIVFALANLYWPFYLYFEDSPVYRFVWLGVFFILLEIALEIIQRAVKNVKLISEEISLGVELKKIGEGFRVLSGIALANNLKADYVVIGSSGVWLVEVVDEDGAVNFNGDDLVQKGNILKGLVTHTLEKSYALAEFLKSKINRDFMVSPVVVFSDSKVNFQSVPASIRGVRVVLKKDLNSTIGNTDVQLLDTKTIDEAAKSIKNK